MSRLSFDPEAIPIDSLAEEREVSVERLTPEYLRRRFQEELTWYPEDTMEHLLRGANTPPTDAAVLVPLIAHPHGMTVMLTRRSPHLSDHAGQISFPGGRVEADDADRAATALRETEEEVGLSRTHIEVLGQLPDYFTGTGYRVTPIVGIVTPPFSLQADSFEVAEVFEVPLQFLMTAQHHQRRRVELPNNAGSRTFYAMPYHEYFIWGATAGMLRNLFHFLRA